MQVFISFYEEKNAFTCYKNSLSQKTNACHQHFQNIIIKELLENEEIYDLNYENCFSSLFSLQTFPLSLNFIKLIEKYAEKLVFDENSRNKSWDLAFPNKDKIQSILQPSFQHLKKKKNPEAILLIYFLLHYLHKINQMNNKENKNSKYDIIFLYSLPTQFHIYLYQIFVSELDQSSEKFSEEIKLNENLKKLIIIFLPTLRSPAFLFIDFSKLIKI